MDTPKRCLVVVRAGDQSLHPQWTSDPAARAWDLVVSYFGKDPDRFRGPGKRRIDDKGQKYAGLLALLTREDFWREYDYIWLPDDDLAAEQSTIENLFESMARLDLALAQPALSWTSYFSHPVTLRHPSFRLRMTNFIEIMAPCFHRPFLETCLPTFGENMSGWGLDWVWPRMLLPDRQRCAIIDNVVVTHTRPIGGPTYDRLRAAGITPRAEGEALLRRFGIPLGKVPEVFAALDADGNLLEQSRSDDCARIDALRARDWAAFGAFRRQREREAAERFASLRRPIYASEPIRWRLRP
jgi:hypothetical protein